MTGRLAILVPDKNFREQLTKKLRQALPAKFEHRCFKLTRFDSAARPVPVLVASNEEEEEEEIIVVDSLTNSRGLEQMLVIGVALDSPIGQGADNSIRSGIYLALTRAQLLAVVVNHVVPEGWLAFLQRLDFREETLGNTREMNSQAAHKVLEPAGPKPPQSEHPQAEQPQPEQPQLPQLQSQQPQLPQLQSQQPQQPTNLEPPTDSRQTTTAMLSRPTKVWDVRANVHVVIPELLFNPLKAQQTLLGAQHRHFTVLAGLVGSKRSCIVFGCLVAVERGGMVLIMLACLGCRSVCKCVQARFLLNFPLDQEGLCVRRVLGCKPKCLSAAFPIWEAISWKEERPSGTLPPARFAHAMVYDPKSQSLLVFGGLGLGTAQHCKGASRCL